MQESKIHRLYRPLSGPSKVVCGLDGEGACESDDVQMGNGGGMEDIVRAWMPGVSRPDVVVEKSIKTKGLRLDNFTSPEEAQKRAARKCEKKNKKVLSRTQLKRQGLLDIKNDGLRYSYEGQALHHLWLQYIGSVLPSGPTLARCQSLAVSDMHGAFLTVLQSRNPSHVNLSGIVMEETERTFIVLSPDDRLRTLPKADCVFYLPINDVVHVIHGQNFCHRTAQRSKMKVKSKYTIML